MAENDHMEHLRQMAEKLNDAAGNVAAYREQIGEDLFTSATAELKGLRYTYIFCVEYPELYVLKYLDQLPDSGIDDLFETGVINHYHVIDQVLRYVIISARYHQLNMVQDENSGNELQSLFDGLKTNLNNKIFKQLKNKVRRNIRKEIIAINNFTEGHFLNTGNDVPGLPSDIFTPVDSIKNLFPLTAIELFNYISDSIIKNQRTDILDGYSGSIVGYMNQHITDESRQSPEYLRFRFYATWMQVLGRRGFLKQDYEILSNAQEELQMYCPFCGKQCSFLNSMMQYMKNGFHRIGLRNDTSVPLFLLEEGETENECWQNFYLFVRPVTHLEGKHNSISTKKITIEHITNYLTNEKYQAVLMVVEDGAEKRFRVKSVFLKKPRKPKEVYYIVIPVEAGEKIDVRVVAASLAIADVPHKTRNQIEISLKSILRDITTS
ncbi:MAG: hypothetical protein ACOCWZ_11620 [Spirochaetota bacterium]